MRGYNYIMKKKSSFNTYLIIAFFIAVTVYTVLTVFFHINKDQHRLEAVQNKRRVIGMSFGGGNKTYHDLVESVRRQLSETGVFDEVFAFTDLDLKSDADFWNKHQNFIENNHRGYGYWIWKPYLIMKTLENMNEGDILLYLDSGCDIKSDANHKLTSLLDRCDSILYTSTGQKEKTWTKMDIFSEMNMLNNQDIMMSEQHQAGVLFINKNEITMNFIRDWYSMICKYNLVDDSPSGLPNDETFKENRHDQSLFNVIIKSEKYKEYLNNENNLISDYYPILISRNRTV